MEEGSSRNLKRLENEESLKDTGFRIIKNKRSVKRINTLNDQNVMKLQEKLEVPLQILEFKDDEDINKFHQIKHDLFNILKSIKMMENEIQVYNEPSNTEKSLNLQFLSTDSTNNGNRNTPKANNKNASKGKTDEKPSGFSIKNDSTKISKSRLLTISNKVESKEDLDPVFKKIENSKAKTINKSGKDVVTQRKIFDQNQEKDRMNKTLDSKTFKQDSKKIESNKSSKTKIRITKINPDEEINSTRNHKERYESNQPDPITSLSHEKINDQYSTNIDKERAMTSLDHQILNTQLTYDGVFTSN